MVFQRQRLPESNNHFSEVKTVAFITRLGKLQLFFPSIPCGVGVGIFGFAVVNGEPETN